MDPLVVIECAAAIVIAALLEWFGWDLPGRLTRLQRLSLLFGVVVFLVLARFTLPGRWPLLVLVSFLVSTQIFRYVARAARR
jgi:hypothetical protein